MSAQRLATIWTPIGTQGLQMLPSRLLIFDMPRRRDAPPLRMTYRTSCRRRLNITLKVRPSDCCQRGHARTFTQGRILHRFHLIFHLARSGGFHSKSQKRVYLKEPPKCLTPSFQRHAFCAVNTRLSHRTASSYETRTKAANVFSAGRVHKCNV